MDNAHRQARHICTTTSLTAKGPPIKTLVKRKVIGFFGFAIFYPFSNLECVISTIKLAFLALSYGSQCDI